MKFIVQKIPARDVSHLQKEIPGLIIVEDKVKDPVGCFVRCLEASGPEAQVHLEDDVHVVPNFVFKVKAATEEEPGRMISFFTLRKITERTIMHGRDFLMNQCFYLPPGMAQDAAQFYHQVWKQNNTDRNPDVFFRHYLKYRGHRYMLWYPCLVQHLQLVSAIDPRRSKFRQTKTFEGNP